MANNGSPREFWKIMEASFPEAAHDRHLEEQRIEQARQANLRSDKDDERWERMIAASYDERIAGYFLDGIGDEESLIAQLQREYGLSEEDAEKAIDKSISQFTEVVDYGDEA